jgi:hypothetical protein
VTTQPLQQRALAMRNGSATGLEALLTPAPTFDAVLEGKLRRAVHEWRNVLGRQATQARQVLAKLLVEQFTIVPEWRDGIRGFSLRATGSLTKLIAFVISGEILSLQAVAPPLGLDPLSINGNYVFDRV